MPLIRFILSVACLCLCGCVIKQSEQALATNAGSRELTEAIFFQAFRDFTQSGEITPVQSGGIGWQILVLPISVEQLVRHKDAALPMLDRIKTSLNPHEAAFAEACISVMTSKNVHRSELVTGRRNGIEMAAYTIAN